MSATTTILVPLDGSAFGEKAIPLALSLGRRLDARLEVISVADSEPTVAGWSLSGERLREGTERYLQDVTTRMRNASEVDVSPAVLDGTVAKALEDYAQRNRPELIVMATHGRGPLNRAWLGSVADRLVRHVSTPILLVRPDENGETRFTTEHEFRNILVPLDGSPRAEASLEWATRIGKGADASYTLLSAVPPPPPVGSPYLPHAVEYLHDALEEGREEVEKYLEAAADRLRARGLSVTTEVIVGARPAVAILCYADEHPTDLIVIATHGRSPLTRLVLGSVADKVVRGAEVPVLVTRPPAQS